MSDVQDPSRNATPTPREPRAKLLDIERGKGLGILLVVYGHLVMAGSLGEPYWYNLTKGSIYLFHMPFFMYLSGFVYFHTGSHLGRRFGKFFQARVDRLLVPFLAISLLVVVAKILGGLLAHVDDGVSNLLSGLWAVISNGPNNPSISVWYLLTLFVYAVSTPFLWRLTHGRWLLLLAIALGVQFIPAPEAFYLARILRYFIFFVLGMAACRYAPTVLKAYRWTLPLTIAAFAVALYVGRAMPHALLICGVLSIPVLHGLLNLPVFARDRVLVWFGENSMVIYLFNTLAIGVAKVLYVRLFPYEGAWFGLLVLVLMISGVFAPIALKAILRRIEAAKPVYQYIQ